MRDNSLLINLTPQIIEEAQKRLEFIMQEGSAMNGVDEKIDTNIKPDWYDEERFKRGQFLIKKHYAAMINVSIAGLLVFLQLPIGLTPLLATGKSKNLSNLFDRYFTTLKFVDEWFISDPFDKNSKSFRTLSMVKLMHLNVNKLMNQKRSVFEFAKQILKEQDPNIDETMISKFIRNKDRVWVSMYDMALVQWGLIGCGVLEPHAAGFHGLSKKEMEDVLYVLKILSYKLGIAAKYSIFEDESYEMVYALCKLILEQEYLPHMENCASPTGIRMMEGVITIFQDILIGSNCNVYLKYWYKQLNVNSFKLNRERCKGDQMKLFKLWKKNQLTDEERQTMLKNGFNDKYIVTNHNVPFENIQLNGLKERMLYQLYLFVVRHLLRYDFGKNLSRKVLKNAITKVQSLQDEMKMKLEKQESARMQFSACPFTGGISMQDDTAVYKTLQGSDKVKSSK